jgi:hypothetical protein
MAFAHCVPDGLKEVDGPDDDRADLCRETRGKCHLLVGTATYS